MNPKMKDKYMEELNNFSSNRFIFRASLDTPSNFICYIYEKSSKFENVEYRGGLNIADNFMFLNIGEIKSKFDDDSIVYVAISKNNSNIQFEFNKEIFELLNPTKYNYFTTTLKKFFMYLISLKLTRLDTISKTVAGNILYSGFNITEAANLLEVRESDLQQILSGLAIKTKVLNLDLISTRLKFDKEEYNPKYYQNLLEEYHE